MSTYEQALAALPDFRAHVLNLQLEEAVTGFTGFNVGGAFAAFATPARNIHATGIGLRLRAGTIVPGEIVLKLFVYEKVAEEALGTASLRDFGGLAVDVEQLPVQQVFRERERVRPVVGGVSIAPLGVNFVGTLGCFVEQSLPQGKRLFALSNNHVLAGVNRLPVGTPIAQPGPETAPFITNPGDAFAALQSFIPIEFPGDSTPVANHFDAAIAAVTDGASVQTGSILNGLRYNPRGLKPPRPGMRVVKCGRTTGVTRGVVTATGVQGVQVNYGTRVQPRITVFEDVVQVANPGGTPFSLPGDSGSVILEEMSGDPVALLFAGDGFHTSACDMVNLCRRLRVLPV